MIDIIKPTNIELKQQTAEETKAYLEGFMEGFNNAYKTFRHELETQDSEMAAINIMELLVKTVNGVAMKWEETKCSDVHTEK